MAGTWEVTDELCWMPAGWVFRKINLPPFPFHYDRIPRRIQVLPPIEYYHFLWYDDDMNTHLPSQPPSILDQLLTPVGDCLTPEVARHLVDLHASADVQARLEDLADKSTEGQLSAEERAEYATAVAAIEFISVLQAKARRLLSQPPA